MYLSQETVRVLKNFATINQSILIKPGNVLTTMSVMKNILSKATITETFEKEVGIYDLHQFLNALSLIPGAELQLGSSSVHITDGKNTIDYRYSDPSVIVSPPEKELTLPSQDVCVVFLEEHIEKVKKAAAILQIPDISLVGDAENIYLTVSDKKNSGSNTYKIQVGETSDVFKFNMKVENLKLLGGDYDVVVSSKNLAHLMHHSQPIEYYIALEPDSTFESN